MHEDLIVSLDGKTLSKCRLCRRRFQFGEHIYKGRAINEWDIMVCEWCYASNRDGIVPQSHPDLIQHLEKRGIGVKLNAKGWIDWPS
jgi:hypothetical protein